MYTIIAGTNRPDSKSSEVAAFYSQALSERDITNQIVDLKDLPYDFTESALYSKNGSNEDFNQLRIKVESADKLIFIIPEYNGSFPGVLKAFIDGFGYPNGVKNKKAALIGISDGALGSALAISHFTDILNYLNCSVFAIKPRLTSVSQTFVDGTIQNELINKLVKDQIEGFITF